MRKPSSGRFSRRTQETLIAAGALDALVARLDRAITGEQANATGSSEPANGYLPMGGQIVDASLVAAPRQRNTEAEKAAIKAGGTADEVWPDKPAKARQKGAPVCATGSSIPADEARRTLKFAKGRAAADGTPQTDIAIPAFGYKSHTPIDRRHGIIRCGKVTDAFGAALGPVAGGPSPHDGARLHGARLREGLIDPNNTASDVWADSAYRSAQNERFLASVGKRSRIHRKTPKGKPMPKRTARANAARSALRAPVEHPFAHQKGPMNLLIRTVGLARATAAVTLANMAYNMKRWCWLDRRSVPA